MERLDFPQARVFCQSRTVPPLLFFSDAGTPCSTPRRTVESSESDSARHQLGKITKLRLSSFSLASRLAMQTPSRGGGTGSCFKVSKACHHVLSRGAGTPSFGENDMFLSFEKDKRGFKEDILIVILLCDLPGSVLIPGSRNFGGLRSHFPQILGVRPPINFLGGLSRDEKDRQKTEK
jgi:hypothetical protein